jgi:hypothetical protein
LERGKNLDGQLSMAMMPPLRMARRRGRGAAIDESLHCHRHAYWTSLRPDSSVNSATLNSLVS